MDPIVEQNDLPATPPPDIAPAAPEPSDDVEQLLAEFDRANNQGGQQTPVQEDPIADLLRDPADQQRIGELTGELDGLRGEVHRKAELEAFDKFSSELQAKLPEHLPPDYSRNALLAAAAQDPNLQAAWGYRGITPAQRAQADAEFRQLEQLHAQVLRAPDDGRKASALAQIENAGRTLGLMLNSREILRRLERDIVNRASEFKPIDQDATADRNAVAAAVRDGGGKVTADPPPNLGAMTNNELREYTRKNFGFV
jgi:hypothetical protein